MSVHLRSVFITGANRGIGFGLVKGFLGLETPPKHIFATCRDVETSEELRKLASENKIIHIIKLDVTDYAALPSVVTEVEKVVGDDGLNLLINNAGELKRETNSLTDVTPQHMRREYEVNTIAPLIISQHFLPLIKKAAGKSNISGMSCTKAAILNMGSRVGSCGDNDSGSRYPYRCSKAALNMVTKSMSVDLKEEGILAAVLHPGWVQTDMGGPSALITTDECIDGIFKVINSLDESKTGTFWHSNGQQLQW